MNGTVVTVNLAVLICDYPFNPHHPRSIVLTKLFQKSLHLHTGLIRITSTSIKNFYVCKRKIIVKWSEQILKEII